MFQIPSLAISVLLHPVFMPVYALLMVFNSGTYLSYIPYEAKKYIFLVVLLNTVVIPLSLLPVFFYKKVIHGIAMEHRRERTIPLLVYTILLYVAYYFLARMQVPGILKSFILVSCQLVLLLSFVSWFWKISLHMAGIGGLTGLLVAMSVRLAVGLNLFLIVLILFAGLLGTVRLLLNEHNPAQVYAGYLLGFAVICGGLLFL